MSRTGSSLLPRFDAPPVEEVRIGVVFAPLPISVTELPVLFETYSDRYPETHAAQARRVRVDPSIGSGFRVEFTDDPGIPRIRFSSSEHDRWLEIQSDAFTCGWRRRADGGYPSYDELRSDFQELALKFAGFVDQFHPDEDIYAVAATVEYKNRFEMGSADAATALSEAFIVTAPKEPFSSLPPLSTAGLQLRFDFEHEEEVYARLIARANMGMRGTTMIGRFDLRFSGDPFATSGDLEAFDAILKFLDEGHVAVVQAFDQTTTPVMHKRWGREER